MAYEVRLDMSIASTAIIAAVQELQEQHETFGYEVIANRISCSEITVKRHMPKLIQAKKIARIGENHSRCRYEVVK